MYNVGFGDSFLLLFPAPDGRRHKVLIDCGVHRSASVNPPPIKDVIAQIIKDVTDKDGVPRIDVVIATHRHQDHVLGFENADWDSVVVQEVWMPWTEHPKDKQAKKIREAQSKSASRAFAMAQRMIRLSLTPAEREKIERAMVIASNNLTNKKAMKTLHSGFSDTVPFALRRYLPENESGQTLEPSVLPGVKVHVMGPSRDPDVIAVMENDSEMYHLLATFADSSDVWPPFRSERTLTPAQFATSYKHLALSKSTITAATHLGDVDQFAAAAQLEGAVNGTSLMLMFEVGEGFLLFPGDAQWGTWEQALSNDQWRELLERTNFYKIGHHGSHNATPITFVEKVLGKNFWAMASTGPTKKWTKIIPRKKLLEKLRAKSDKVIRSDRKDVPDPELSNFKRVAKNTYVEVELKV
jgi:beta-lactamase superfamily II metal-dependent hydrolase